MFILASSASYSMSWMRLKRELILLRARSTSCASRAVTLAPRYCPMFAALTCMLLCSSVFVQTITVTIQSVPVQTELDAWPLVVVLEISQYHLLAEPESPCTLPR